MLFDAYGYIGSVTSFHTGCGLHECVVVRYPGGQQDVWQLWPEYRLVCPD